MANYSQQTRKEQVLARLLRSKDQWVDAPELANEQVGGSEGLKRLRELRMEGYRIEMRRHPDPRRDIYQYMLSDQPQVMPRGAAPSRRFSSPPTQLRFGEVSPCPRCKGKGKVMNSVSKQSEQCPRCNGFGLVPLQ